MLLLWGRSWAIRGHHRAGVLRLVVWVFDGSANINIRSMLGKRDSELAVIVEDTELVASLMDEQPYQAGKFTLGLSKDCFTDHFFNDVWNQTAVTNTTLYDQIFRCLPTNAVQTHRTLREYSAVPSMAVTDRVSC